MKCVAKPSDSWGNSGKRNQRIKVCLLFFHLAAHS